MLFLLEIYFVWKNRSGEDFGEEVWLMYWLKMVFVVNLWGCGIGRGRGFGILKGKLGEI